MVESLYCEYSGRSSINLVVLFKIVLIQHLYRCPFLRWAEEAIEWVFADDKEKHAMRYTLVKLKFAAMNLKKWPVGCGRRSPLHSLLSFFGSYTQETRLMLDAYAGFLDRLWSIAVAMLHFLI
ncbi:hypothetical protein [Intestinimonas butyriciproducens]|uniref:hypothetical protein n=1 Tax=Intestinimonas butyriciproducens TaxID=1297617 RepID=UPI0019583337|nr:hypothetical protein [Intestinimonas butyriciproducens]MBM6975178.1 hypothetical protein [Intestinimonas butyriciproducens]